MILLEAADPRRGEWLVHAAFNDVLADDMAERTLRTQRRREPRLEWRLREITMPLRADELGA